MLSFGNTRRSSKKNTEENIKKNIFVMKIYDAIWNVGC